MHWIVGIAYTVLTVSLCGLCLRVGWRNLVRYRATAGTPPIDVREVLDEPTPVLRLPPGWLEPGAIDDLPVAVAYREYAFDRRVSAMGVADTLMLALAAAFGAALPGAAHGRFWLIAGELVLLVMAFFVVLARHYVERGWTRRIRVYERRRAVLAERVRRTSARRRRRSGP